MNRPTTVDEVIALYEDRGLEHYGEDVNQLEHGLQCAALAQADGASDALVAAALLHDIGHLVVDVQADEGYRMGVDDDVHESVGAKVLAPIFGPAVAQPVALHVTAKRYRCAVDPAYLDALSATSTATLAAQGGPLDDEGCRRFASHPGHEDALRLRTWDDTGKMAEMATPSLGDFRPLLERLALARG
jgi:phosphonate degradation associated HDIG domain protein